MDKLGSRGELVSVQNGYMFNYLFPQGLAKKATKDILACAPWPRGAPSLPALCPLRAQPRTATPCSALLPLASAWCRLAAGMPGRASSAYAHL